MSSTGEPRAKATSLSARMPQVGASSQEIGSAQLGRSATGISSPVTSQTGNSNMFPTAQPARNRTTTDAITKPSSPIETIVGGIERAKSSGRSSSSGIPNRSRPQSSVEADPKIPTVN